jgi:Cys-tRNA(Pro)/Cys-tRNA(Cys) deacylase
MSAPTPAVVALQAAQVVHRLHVLDDLDGGYGALEVAEALGVRPDRVFKTLVLAHPGGHAVAVVPAPARLDPKAMARALSVKRVGLAGTEEAQRLSRSVVGAISPFGFTRSLPTVLDDSATGHGTIFVSGGRRGLEVEVAPMDLVDALACAVVRIAR